MVFVISCKQASKEDILHKAVIYSHLMAVVYWLLEFLINVHPYQSHFYGFLHI